MLPLVLQVASNAYSQYGVKLLALSIKSPYFYPYNFLWINMFYKKIILELTNAYLSVLQNTTRYFIKLIKTNYWGYVY